MNTPDQAGSEASGRPRLRRPAPETDGPAVATQPTPFPLAIAGVVVTRQQLVAALQPFVPGLADIEAFEDGERFLFVFDPEAASRSPTPAAGNS